MCNSVKVSQVPIAVRLAISVPPWLRSAVTNRPLACDRSAKLPLPTSICSNSSQAEMLSRLAISGLVPAASAVTTFWFTNAARANTPGGAIL